MAVFQQHFVYKTRPKWHAGPSLLAPVLHDLNTSISLLLTSSISQSFSPFVLPRRTFVPPPRECQAGSYLADFALTPALTWNALPLASSCFTPPCIKGHPFLLKDVFSYYSIREQDPVSCFAPFPDPALSPFTAHLVICIYCLWCDLREGRDLIFFHCYLILSA